MRINVLPLCLLISLLVIGCTSSRTTYRMGNGVFAVGGDPEVMEKRDEYGNDYKTIIWHKGTKRESRATIYAAVPKEATEKKPFAAQVSEHLMVNGIDENQLMVSRFGTNEKGLSTYNYISYGQPQGGIILLECDTPLEITYSTTGDGMSKEQLDLIANTDCLSK